MNEIIVPFWNGTEVGITGAGGFIGSNLCTELASLGARILSFDRQQLSVPEQLSNSQVVFHLAGQTSAYIAQEDPESDYVANVELTGHVLKSVANPQNPPRFVFASTSTIVGVTGNRTSYGGLDANPSTVYDEHKLLAEKGIEMFTEAGLVHGVSLRLTNVYGPGPASSGNGRGLVNVLIKKALSGEPITLYGDGSYVRDYIFVDDAIAAFLASAEAWNPSWQPHYVIGAGVGRTILEMAECVLRTVQSKTSTCSKITFVKEPPNLLDIDRRSYVAPIEDFVRDAKWRPIVEFEEGIERTVAFYLSQRTHP